MTKECNEIHYLDSFMADTHIVRQVVDKLLEDLKKMKYPKEECDEIILAMDEGITNAVQETLFSHKSAPHSHQCGNEITVRYRVTKEEFDATIIDHGKGLDINTIFDKIPDSTAPDYREQLFSYAKEAGRKKIRVRLNGKEITINGIGAGLKIILSFMDNLYIDLIDKKSGISDQVGCATDGSIITMSRKRRYT